MNLQQQLEEIEAKFENAKAEMHRYQGEYRAIKALIDAEVQDGQPEVATITAKPEEDKK